MAWEADLRGSTAVVSGASRGIGRAIAVMLGRAGADVVGIARSGEALEDLSAQLVGLGRRALPVVADLSRPASVESAADEAWRWRGRVDVLVNAAGVMHRSEPPDVEQQDWDRTFDVNARAAFFLAQSIGSRMFDAGGGAIVNVASLAGEVPTSAPIAYQASKAALIQTTRALATRWAPTVRVNAIGPGYVRTQLNEDWLADEQNLRWVRDRTTLARLGTVDDIAGPAVFLASSAAAYITGQHLLVDGGFSLGASR